MTNKNLKISSQAHLPLEAVTDTFAILARRRVGKTYTGSVMFEEMVYAGLPAVALDPTGAWWGVGSSRDGKSEGLPVIIIGGPHAHIPLEPGAGKIIADLVVDHPGWYVIDFSRLNHRDEELLFAQEFGARLYRRKQHNPSPLHLFIDEADMFVPQKIPKRGKEMLDSYDAIVRRGGIYGLGVTLISQRPALVNKDVLTQCANLIALRTSAPEDQDPIFDWVGRYGTAEQVREMRQTLSALKKGEAWFFNADSEMFKKIQIRERNTFNSSATPKPGVARIEPKIFSKVDIDALGEKIKGTVEKAKLDDPVYLRREIERLELELAAKPREVSKTVQETKTVPLFEDKDYQKLAMSFEKIDAKGKALQSLMRDFYENTQADISKIISEIGIPKTLMEQVNEKVKSMQQVNSHSITLPKTGYTYPATATKFYPMPKKPNETLTDSERNVLILCAQYPTGITKKRITVLSGLARSTRDKVLNVLGSRVFIDAQGQLVMITEHGINYLGDNFTPLPTGDALREYWLSKLPDGPREVFKIICERYPKSISKKEVDSLARIARSTRDKHIALLSARMLVTSSGGSVRASEELYS